MSQAPAAGRRAERLTAALQSILNRMESHSFPRLQTGEIYGAITLGVVVMLVLVFRWWVG
jgi:hypothetical protein